MKQLVCLVFLLIGANLYSQRTINGVVKDEKGEGLPFVSIVIKGSNKGTKSNDQGEYLLAVPDSAGTTLRFSFIGYETQEIIVGTKTIINVTLESSVSLEEVVVVGYGSATKKELTGATSKVGGEDVEKLNLSRMDQALQGQVSGVNISTNSGSPGGASNIRIRGLSTFGDNDPLILVDGVVYDSEGLNALNPSDIKSINILKDATAGIYGVRAANGVILVETKIKCKTKNRNK